MLLINCRSVFVSLQNALLDLASVIDTLSLRAVISDVLSTIIPNVENIFIYLLDVSSNKMLCDNPPHEMSKEGRLRSLLITVVQANVPAVVIIIPVVDEDVGRVISVIVIYCGILENVDEFSLNLLEKHVVSKTWPFHFLSGELYDQDAASLQLKVIHYLQEETHSACCCMLVSSEDNGQLFCRVVGDKVLEEEIIFPEQHRQLNNILGFEVYSMLCVPVISKATAQALLQVARNLFTHLDNVSVLLQEIIQEARTLTNAESCSVFLLEQNNKELVAKVFDGGFVADESAEFRMPADQGIAGHVATTGKILNIKDAYSHPLFYRGVDDSTGFRTRNILCFPIIDDNNQIVGVAELCNKINGPWFTKFDEDLALAFSIYCGISIAHSLLYKKVHEAQYRSHLANEMMMYHLK
ncbi:hypothetical protein chiPu_0020375, partial [Chiloscyllium punctatum]|nr:hypothetical protein [Chiloscyllium punctatum]